MYVFKQHTPSRQNEKKNEEKETTERQDTLIYHGNKVWLFIYLFQKRNGDFENIYCLRNTIDKK